MTGCKSAAGAVVDGDAGAGDEVGCCSRPSDIWSGMEDTFSALSE
jgi:hypothetical protein